MTGSLTRVKCRPPPADESFLPKLTSFAVGRIRKLRLYLNYLEPGTQKVMTEISVREWKWKCWHFERNNYDNE